MKILFKIFIIFIIFILLFVAAEVYLADNPRINHMDSSVMVNMNFSATNYSNMNDVIIYVNTTVEGSPILNMENYDGAIQVIIAYIGNNASDSAKNLSDFRGNPSICLLNNTGSYQDINISNLKSNNCSIMFGVNITANKLQNITHIVDRCNAPETKGYYAPRLGITAMGNSVVGSLSIKLNHAFIYVNNGSQNTPKVMQHTIYTPNKQKEHLFVKCEDTIEEAETRTNESLVIT